MAAANIISVIGTGITLLSFLLDSVPEAKEQTKISYIIANDGANGGKLTNAGGHLPDLRLWDETGEYLGGKMDPGKCGEGSTDCTTDVNTQQAATYTLFSGNQDAICIAWTGMAWAGGQKSFGFHPGNWAHACDVKGKESGNWYYAGTVVPGIKYDDDVFCGWVDSDGDLETTGFQVHWPEFDGDKADMKSLDYYCDSRPPVNFRKEKDPSTVWRWTKKRNLFARDPSVEMSPAGPSPAERRREAADRQTESLSKRMAKDTRIVKSHFAKHHATELCGSSKSVGQSFVSYADRKFCYMPTKTLYSFCSDVDTGACWSDNDNKVIIKGDGGDISTMSKDKSVPDLGHITDSIVWGQE